MRNLVLQLQREFHMTVILVTHDREEALSMSNRIALMFSGRLVQTGTPKEVYLRPESRLAADYFGDCVYINGTLSGGRFTGGGLDCPVPFLSQEFISQAIPFPADAPVPGPSVPDGPCRLMLRPEAWSLTGREDIFSLWSRSPSGAALSLYPSGLMMGPCGKKPSPGPWTWPPETGSRHRSAPRMGSCSQPEGTGPLENFP